jgi:putative glycosyltransferase
MPMISVVTSLYRSAAYIEEFHARHLECLKEMGLESEFIFVNDGSPDNSEHIVRRLIASSPGVTLVSLSRNFGQHAAMFAGLAHARGDYVYTADCDLEEEPENIRPMYDVMRADTELDTVYSVIDKRGAGVVRDWLSRLFYAILNALSGLHVDHNQTWQRIMSKQYVEQLLRYREVQSLPGGLMVLVGFNQRAFPIRKKYKGWTSYSFSKRLVLAVNSVISFSSVPLLVISCFGLCITGISFICIAILTVSWLLGSGYQGGWPSLIASIWCVGGLVLLSVGVVGIYLARVFEQVKNRPQYVIRRLYKS